MAEAELREAVRALLRRNQRRGYSALLGRSYSYIAPALKTYPFQFFWDTCFHVILLARLGECEQAKRNLRSLFSMQEDNGFVGHMIFWEQVLPRRRSDVMQARPSFQALRPHMSALIQPPFGAIALHALFEASGDRVYLGELYARLKRQHEWLARERDFDGDGLLSIISPFESGMDWKPSYDEALGYAQRRTPARLLTSSLYWKGVGVDLSNFVRRYDLARIRQRGRFLVKDAGVNAAYAVALQCMEKLAPIAGDDPRVYATRRARVLEGMMRLMYDRADAAFYDVQEPHSRKLRVRTPTILFPLAIDELEPAVAARLVDAHFDRDGFRAAFPLPSVERGDPAFRAEPSQLIWRGPTWAYMDWFLFHALRKRGFAGQAAALRRSLAALVQQSGFREYYNPLTGEGGGAEEFTWSGLLLDMVEPRVAADREPARLLQRSGSHV
jgi:glycogen debranching enzyme